MTSWGKEQREGLQETWLTSWRFLARTLKMHFFRSTLTQFCMSTGGQEGAGSRSNKASLAGSGYGFHKPSANFWKTLKAREISLLAKKMIKWKQPPFKRLMSSVSAKKRPGSPLWEPRVTSPPIRALLPSSAAPSWGGWGDSPLANVTLSLTKLLDLVCLPDSIAKWKRAPGRGDQSGWGGVRSWPGGPYSHSTQKVLYFLQQPRRRPLGRMQPPDNAVSAEYCGPFSQATVAISFFAEWDSLWWFAERQGSHLQCSFKDAPTKKAQIVGPFSQSKQKICVGHREAHFESGFMD